MNSIVVQGESTGPSMTAPKALVVVSGYTGSGKSTIAEAIAEAIGATTISFDWVMSALRTFPEVWAVVESPVERQRSVGWTLMGRIAEQQLRPGRGRVVSGGIGVESEVEQPIRPGRSVVLDLVGRHGALEFWADLAERTGAKMSIVECVCSDADVHRARVVGRDRGIPGWYELTVADVERSRAAYQPLDVAKIVVDSVNPLEQNLDAVMKHLNRAV